MAGESKDNMLRPDGTRKGRGWLGPRARPDGRVSTEISVGVEMDGKETLIPLMVPGLTEEELGYLLKNDERSPEFQRNMPRSITDKAVAHAVNLLRQGKSPFAPEKTPPAFPARAAGNPFANQLREVFDKVRQRMQPDGLQGGQAQAPGARFQALADNAPVGSVGAPGGIQRPGQQPTAQDGLSALLTGGAMVPGPVGDVAGPLADAYMYATEPESRTLGNAAMSALGALPFLPSLATVYHGSPHKFDAFDLSKIGTGEGAQAYGHGLYLADSPEVAKGYATLGHTQGNISTIKGKNILDVYGALDKSAARLPPKVAQTNYDKMALLENLMNNQTPSEVMSYAKENGYSPEVLRWFETDVLPHYQGSGNLYTVDLPDEAIAKMLDWDKPLSEQAPEVQKAVEAIMAKRAAAAEAERIALNAKNPGRLAHPVLGKLASVTNEIKPFDYKGQAAVEELVKELGGPEKASEYLRAQGIPGIRYLDEGSRAAGQGTSNYVVFDPQLLTILSRE